MSAQLGHADVAVTAKHYAAWCGGVEYRDPLHVAPTELPADLLARIAPDFDSPHVPLTSGETDVGAEAGSDTNLNEIKAVGGSGGWTRTNDLRLMKPPL